jgi:hypothetical protein
MTADVTHPGTAILAEHVKVEQPIPSTIQIDIDGNLIISEVEHLATLSGTARVASGNKTALHPKVPQSEGVLHWQDKP